MNRTLLALAAACAVGLAGQVLAQQPGARQGSAASPKPAQQSPKNQAGGQADSQAATPDQAQPSDDQSPDMNRPQLSDADRAFLLRAYADSLSEVQLGQLAVQKGTTIGAKQFGTRMATDHGQASQVLTQIASDADVELPTQPERMAMATYQRLRGIPGSDFDNAFAQAMVQAHQRDIIEFRKEAQSGKDPALKDFAQKSLPMLQQHLMMARALLAPSG